MWLICIEMSEEKVSNAGIYEILDLSHRFGLWWAEMPKRKQKQEEK
jgi:hypothetical protein